MYNQVTVKSTALRENVVLQPRMNKTGSNNNADMLKLALPSDETTQWVSKQLCHIFHTYMPDHIYCSHTHCGTQEQVFTRLWCSTTVIQSALSWLHSIGYKFIPSMLTSQRNSSKYISPERHVKSRRRFLRVQPAWRLLSC